MNAASAKIERAIQNLPVDDMVSIHERLIRTIHDKADSQGLDPEFCDEIRQRIKDIDAGKVKGVDAFRALRKM
jgi:hypothetical protein